MKRVVLGGFALLVLAGAAWFLFLREGGGATPGDAGPDAKEGAAPPDAEGGPRSGPTLAKGDGAKGTRARRAAPDAPKGSSAIVGTVRRGGAPAAARVELRFLFDV